MGGIDFDYFCYSVLQYETFAENFSHFFANQHLIEKLAQENQLEYIKNSPKYCAEFNLLGL
jgi:hypothetical protein